MIKRGEVPSFNDLTGAKVCLERMCDGTTIANLAYLVNSTGEKPTIVSTYRGPWVDRYIEENYVAIDPAIVKGNQGILPYDWNSNLTNDKLLSKFFGEASEFGVHHNGVSIPVRDARGGLGTFSVNSALPDKEWKSFKREFLGDLTIFAYHYHLQALSVLHPSGGEAAHLSPQELRVLYWAAEGKTSWETATILSLTENTVNFYVRNICSKLRTVSKYQAIAVAIRAGLLQ